MYGLWVKMLMTVIWLFKKIDLELWFECLWSFGIFHMTGRPFFALSLDTEKKWYLNLLKGWISLFVPHISWTSDLIWLIPAILNFQICIVNFSIFLQPYCLRNTLYYWSLPDLTSFILRHWSFRNAVVDGLYYSGCSFVCVYRQFSYTVCDELCWTVPDKRTQRGSTGGCQNLLSASHTLPQCRRL